MIKYIVVEGPRGTGKSTVTRLLRNQIEGSTLINLTGFKEDGINGLAKIGHYYDSFMKFLKHLKGQHGDYTIIFDRLFFSEMVYSSLYKQYDFKTLYDMLCVDLVSNPLLEVHVFYLTCSDTDEVTQRLNRDKVELFESVPENVQEFLKQRDAYDTLFQDYIKDYGVMPNLFYAEIDTAGKTIDEVAGLIRSRT